MSQSITLVGDLIRDNMKVKADKDSDVLFSNGAPCGYRCRKCGESRPLNETTCSCNKTEGLKQTLGAKLLLLEKRG